MTAAEKWARKRHARLSEEAGINQPELVWRVSRTQYGTAAPKPYSSGHCYYGWNWYGRIVITEGADEVDAKCTYLHEMAHIITRSGHNDRFYLCLWKLIRQEKLPIRGCWREKRKGAGRRAYLATRPGRSL